MIPTWAASMRHGTRAMTQVLWAPEGFWASLRFQPTIHTCIGGCNGCGTAKSFWVPDTIWGLLVTVCCNIHDWMCGLAETTDDREWCDKVFFQNLCAFIRRESNCLMRYPRLQRALLYFRGVQFGTWAEAKGVKL